MNRTVLLSDLTFHSYGSRTPSARAEVASQLFLDRAATPPRLRRGISLHHVVVLDGTPGSRVPSTIPRVCYGPFCITSLRDRGRLKYVFRQAWQRYKRNQRSGHPGSRETR